MPKALSDSQPGHFILKIEVAPIDGKHQKANAHADEGFPQAFCGTDRIESARVGRCVALQGTAKQDEGDEQHNRKRKHDRG
jgi:hypothetical protein